MPFTIRPYCRIPVSCPVTYQTGLFEGYGTVWNLSLTGWRFSGDLPLRIGEVCSLTVTLPPYQLVYVAAGIVRWVRGEEYGRRARGEDGQRVSDRVSPGKTSGTGAKRDFAEGKVGRDWNTFVTTITATGFASAAVVILAKIFS